MTVHLADDLTLPCGLRLENRLAKAAMSDSLGDGAGDPTDEQVELYRRWAAGGVGLSIIGEVQIDPRFAERPGNIVIGPATGRSMMATMAAAGSTSGAHIWPQLGHAGALADPAISRPAGPSALSIDGFECDELPVAMIEALPGAYAAAALRAKEAGFTGVEVHAAHGFVLSQFLSPLFNRRTDRWGGSIEGRAQVVVAVIRAIRAAVGPEFAVGVKLNSSDQLEGGLSEDDALDALSLIAEEAVDLLDISGGTYFPGATASSDQASSGPYFLDFARRARSRTDVPLMLTGGFKTRAEASAAVEDGTTDVVGLARAMALDPELPRMWLGSNDAGDPEFPRFATRPPGGVTAWYTMRLADIAARTEDGPPRSIDEAIRAYEERDASRVATWNRRFPAEPDR